MSVILPTPESIAKSRSWLTFSGVFFILVGIFAIAFPFAASMAIAQVIGIVLIVSGIFSLGAVLFGAEKSHRIATVVLALIRIVMGGLLIANLQAGVEFLTLLLVAFFVAEGVTFIVSSVMLRHNRAWPLIFVNGLVALLLGGMIYNHLPSSADWATGLLYGINSIFYGVALIAYAIGHGRSA